MIYLTARSLTSDSGRMYRQMRALLYISVRVMTLVNIRIRAARRSARASCTRRCTCTQTHKNQYIFRSLLSHSRLSRSVPKYFQQINKLSKRSLSVCHKIQ